MTGVQPWHWWAYSRDKEYSRGIGGPTAVTGVQPWHWRTYNRDRGAAVALVGLQP